MTRGTLGGCLKGQSSKLTSFPATLTVEACAEMELSRQVVDVGDMLGE